MKKVVGGLALIVVWGVLQFGVQSTSGFIHLLLAAGVLLVIRGIASSSWGTPQRD